jgi:NADH-quinone oxidoreductase subunit A
MARHAVQALEQRSSEGHLIHAYRRARLDPTVLQCDMPEGRGGVRPIPGETASGGAMQPVLAEYFPILIFGLIAAVIGTAMVLGSILAAHQKPYEAKLEAYECGFEPFDNARRKFDVRFYLVAILFIIFDVEVAFLFPWAVSLSRIGLVGFASMMVFLGVLTVGFIYEWNKGALDWE